MIQYVILFLGKYLGFFHVARLVTRRHIRILGYHGVWYSDGHFGNHLFISPLKFKTRMSWLRNSVYNVIPLGEALAAQEGGNQKPYTTVITIDDGWYGTYRHMLPVLENFGFPATLYVYTGPVDSQKPLYNILVPAAVYLSKTNGIKIFHPVEEKTKEIALANDIEKEDCISLVLGILDAIDCDRAEGFIRSIVEDLGFSYQEVEKSRQFGFMSYDEISDANQRGLDIQLHTHSHRVDPNRPQAIVEEINLNREKLRPYVTSSLTHFCYPSGVFSENMYAYLTDCGVLSATLVDTGLVEKKSNRFALKRILDGETVSQLEFEAEMSGFMEILRKLRAVSMRFQ